jgi:hypothetical protein
MRTPARPQGAGSHTTARRETAQVARSLSTGQPRGAGSRTISARMKGPAAAAWFATTTRSGIGNFSAMDLYLNLFEARIFEKYTRRRVTR